MNTNASSSMNWPSSGAMGEMVRSKNWRHTPLGDPAEWSAYRAAMILACGFPMAIRWGPEP